MKTTLALAALLALSVPHARGQRVADLPADPPAPTGDTVPDLPPPPPPAAAQDGLTPPDPAPAPPAPVDVEPVEPVQPPVQGDLEAPPAVREQEIQASDEGYIIKDAPLNDIFQFLAKEAGRQYFHNSKIASPEYQVTGHLNDGNPLQQMEELAFMYGLQLYTKGNTVYALTQAQLGQLPGAEYHYQLKYLRPTDIETIKGIITPVLSPGSGIVSFEPKTNTIVIIDTAHRIEKARDLLHKIDQAKGQIVVETKILRINSTAGQRKGVNWSSSLGETGTPLEIARSLNSVFGLNSVVDTLGGTSGGSALSMGEESIASNLVLSPIQMNGVLRALAEGGFTSQISNPTLITEDNEQATIAIIDRIPIITTSSTAATSGGNPTVTEEVRYKVDSSDKAITEDPENHREIGISMVVTPQLLSDGTIRMRMRPRSAQRNGGVRGVNVGGVQNFYPQILESMIESIARVPDGHSLVVGGFYGQEESDSSTKVPLLGDIPVINFFFKSKETAKENTSLVFVVTPTSYDPTSRSQNHRHGTRIQNNIQLPRDHNWVDPDCNPGPAHEPNLRRALRGAHVQQAPYYPRTSQQGAPPASAPSGSAKDKPRFSRARR